jgi:transposase
MSRHRHQEFIRFLNQINRQTPAERAVHLIVDNYATHKHPKVRAWLTRHKRFHFHFTPTSACWLNAVEGFFAKLTRRRLKRGVFTGIVDLQAAINRSSVLLFFRLTKSRKIFYAQSESRGFHTASGMRRRSRGQDRAPAVASVMGPSRGRGAMGETRRKRPLARRRSAVSSRPEADVRRTGDIGHAVCRFSDLWRGYGVAFSRSALEDLAFGSPHAFNSRLSSSRKRQSVPSAMIFCGLDLIRPASCMRSA